MSTKSNSMVRHSSFDPRGWGSRALYIYIPAEYCKQYSTTLGYNKRLTIDNTVHELQLIVHELQIIVHQYYQSPSV